MMTPVQVAFKHLPVSDALEAAARDRAAHLERCFRRITSCRVVIASPQRRGRKGRLYSVRIDITVPGEEIVVNREHRFDHAHEDAYLAVRDAFSAARRQLDEHARRGRGEVKSRAPHGTGRVARLLAGKGHGPISTPAGGEVSFHRSADARTASGRVALGEPVRFTEDVEGPPAPTVRVRARRARPREEAA